MFTKGSKRLPVGDEHDEKLHPVSDITHMNDEFGSLFLKELRENLRHMG
jgi:hypothetical protein